MDYFDQQILDNSGLYSVLSTSDTSSSDATSLHLTSVMIKDMMKSHTCSRLVVVLPQNEL